MQTFPKGRLVRIALGRSLGLGGLLEGFEEETDSKGQEVPARAIFKDEDVEIWLGLILAHSKTHSAQAIDSMDALRKAVRCHWIRGVQALKADWELADQSYEKFVCSLVNRRAYLRDAKGGEVEKDVVRKPPMDVREQLSKALREVGIDAEVRGEAIHGPRVSRYRIYLKDVNQLGILERKLREVGLSLNAQSGAFSLETGDESKIVFLNAPRDKDSWISVTKDDFNGWLNGAKSKNSFNLPVYLGVNEIGEPFELAISEAPHVFVAGTTGSGKSVCIHAMIASLISLNDSDQLQLALIDPKQVEFSIYDRHRNLYKGEVAYTSDDAIDMLTSIVAEMEQRYQTFKQRGFSSWSEARLGGTVLPRIVIFVEELADLLLSRNEAERLLVSLAQKARASGIHLVLATQRPDAKTFSGLLRSNIPSRIALTVQKASESNIIMDEGGAEELLGSGDMLVKASGQRAKRVHGVYLTRGFLQAI